jgi:hypothetical protein
METLPAEVFDDGIRFPSLPLSEDGQIARRVNSERRRDVKPLKFRKDAFLTGVANVYEELGGEARLAMWADAHYGEFITKVVAKTLPQAINHMAVHASGPVQIVCSIGESALDQADPISSDGKVIEGAK